MNKPSAREAIVTAVFLTLLGLVDCTGPTQNFSIVHINPDTLKVTFEGRLQQSPPHGLNFYQRRNAVNGFVILHFSPDETVDSPILFTDPASFVKTKSSLQVLMKGVYGTVYARITYLLRRGIIV
ncbi:hypothetical protein [Granulicella sp. dw_53]|uniref:hypothetical protein n=1 Tax=Granulicella sp. dw_53 TaxID=2719792 RepID=UPI001BD43B94|nr:hypothetical protein [Granulicella sp. dw_53]